MPNIPPIAEAASNSSSVVAEQNVDQNKDHFRSHSLSKFDFDLYHEEQDISLPVIRIKRISLPNNGARWKVMENTKVIFIIEGGKLNKKEREFLQSVEGAGWLLSQAKVGIKSINAFKIELKAKLSALNKPVKNEAKKKLK